MVEPFELGNPARYRRDLLAPWPNRIRDGKYSVDNKTFVASINEVSRQTSLHGVVNNLIWNVKDKSDKHVELEVELPESVAYPFSLLFRVRYELSDTGLGIEIQATNPGISKAPYGVSIHPYLIADPTEKVDEWTLDMNSNEVFAVDEKRLLPTRLCEVSELNFDFQQGSIIGDRFIDHAFKVDKAKPRTITLVSQSGFGVKMAFDESSHWIQIHTADREGGSDARRCLAVEPMSCPPDAFNSNIDLIRLNRGESTKSNWWISGIEPTA